MSGGDLFSTYGRKPADAPTEAPASLFRASSLSDEEIAEAMKDKRCEVCGARASFGLGVRLMSGRFGRWFCFEHRSGKAASK